MINFEFLRNKKNVSQKLNILAALFIALSIFFAIGFYRYYSVSTNNFDKMMEIHTLPLSNLVEIKDIYDVNILQTINQGEMLDYITQEDVRDILLLATKLNQEAWKKHYNGRYEHSEHDSTTDVLIRKTYRSLNIANDSIKAYVNDEVSISYLREAISSVNEQLTDLIVKEIENAKDKQVLIQQKRSTLILWIVPIALILFILLIAIYLMLSRNIKMINEDLQGALGLFDNGKFVIFKWKNEEGWPVEFISNNAQEVIGISREAFTSQGVVYSELINPKHAQRVTQETIDNSRNGNDMFVHKPYQIKIPDDKYLWVYDSTTIIRNSKGEITHYIGYIHGIDEQIKKEIDLNNEKTRLDFVAHHDELTSLPNRILFMDRLDHAIKKHERDNDIFAVVFVDLDHFKEINDSFGHDVGDFVLQAAAKKLQEVTRTVDTVSRWGGDEFVVLLENIKHSEDIITIANKILEIFEENIVVDSQAFYISASLGISMYPNDAKDINGLLKNADAAMYKAKDEGRNNYQFYAKEMTTLAFEKVALETQLRDAIEKDELRVYYQAQIDLTTNELIGAEALVRWQHPSLGLVLPSHFIPLAEETELIVHLGSWMLERTMTQMVEWINAGLNPKKVSVNLAGKQILQKELVPRIEQLLKKTGAKAEWIELEVTEGFIMKNPEVAIENLSKLREMGIEIAIDDFGTGYSSLSYLKKLPITKLKIDQSFVHDIETDTDDKAIVKSVIALSHGLGLVSIAEGVENEQQKAYLIAEGCDEMQGYLYAKPISADEYEKQILK